MDDRRSKPVTKSLGNIIDPIEMINGISLEGLHKRVEGSNQDLKELALAQEGQKKDFPDGIDECGADVRRFELALFMRLRMKDEMALLESAVQPQGNISSQAGIEKIQNQIEELRKQIERLEKTMKGTRHKRRIRREMLSPTIKYKQSGA